MSLTRDQIKDMLSQGYSADQILAFGAEQAGPEFGLKETARFGLGQGLAFGWGDEIEAASRAAFSDRSYEEIRDEIRAENEAIREAHPGKALTAEIAGGALTGGAGAARAMGAAAGRNLLARAMLAGSGAGAVQGTGAAQGGVAEHLAGATLGAGVGAGLGLGGYGVGRALARMNPASPAGAAMKRAMAGMSPEEYAARVRELGPGSIGADATKQAQHLTAHLTTRPGPTESMATMLRQREMNKPYEIDQIVRETMGIQGDPRAYEQAARVARREQAKVDYDELLRMPIQPTAEMLDEIKLNPGPAKAALQSTKQARKNAGLPWEVDEDELRSTAGYWDFFSREMRDKGATETGAVKASGVPYLQAAERVTAETDPLTGGALGQAREAYQIASEGLDAFKQAEKFMQKPSDEVIDVIERLDPQQRDLMAAGVTRTLLNKLEKDPQTADTAWNLIKSIGMERKMRKLLGDDDYEKWRKSMDGVMERTATYKVSTTGSRTGILEEQSRAGARENLGFIRSLASGDPLGMAAAVIDRVRPTGMSDATAVALQKAMSAGAEDIDPIVRALLASRIQAPLPGALVTGTGAGLF